MFVNIISISKGIFHIVCDAEPVNNNILQVTSEHRNITLSNYPQNKQTLIPPHFRPPSKSEHHHNDHRIMIL